MRFLVLFLIVSHDSSFLTLSVVCSVSVFAHRRRIIREETDRRERYERKREKTRRRDKPRRNNKRRRDGGKREVVIYLKRVRFY